MRSAAGIDVKRALVAPGIMPVRLSDSGIDVPAEQRFTFKLIGLLIWSRMQSFGD
jgi:hypothetical protein